MSRIGEGRKGGGAKGENKVEGGEKRKKKEKEVKWREND